MLKNLARQVLSNRLLVTEFFFKNAKTAPASHFCKSLSPKFIFSETLTIRCYSSENNDETMKGQSSDHHQNCSSDAASESERMSEDEMRIKIFDSALNHVVKHGWTPRAISLGAADAGFEGSVGEKFDENELLMYFVRESNGKLLNYLQENADKYRDQKNKFIRDAIEYRLRMTIPYINVWAEAMKMMLGPKLFSESTDELSKMVDDIWCYAGDYSSDVEWYIKRGALAQLYAGLQLVMLTDRSEDYKDTWTFLDQR